LNYDYVFSHKFYIWAHKTSLTPPLFIEVPEPRQEIERSCTCVLGYIFYFFLWFSIGFWNCSHSVVFYLFVYQRFSHQYLSKKIIAVSIGLSENGGLYEIFLLDI